MPQPAWLLYGPPGCGKTTWILSHARAARTRVYHWNARTDRSLREGREALHQQVRSQEPLFVWIEGADDLTSEAQAFLRRILETVSPAVQCVLECRDPQRITPAIQSRCEWKQCPSRKSFRQIYNRAQNASSSQAAEPLTLTQSFIAGENPTDKIREMLSSPAWPAALLALRSIGSGSSAWAHVYALGAAAASQPTTQSSNI
jgi:DNA polymerase III delta prime subunit